MADHLRMAEALLFAAVEPLDEEAIAARLPAGADIRTLIDTLVMQYENRGVVLSKAAGKYRFVTAPDVAHVLQKEKVEPKRLDARRARNARDHRLSPALHARGH